MTIQVTCTSAEGLASETPHILKAVRTSGSSLEHRISPTALKLLVSSKLAAVNGGELRVSESSQTELVLVMRLPVSSPA